MKYTILSLFLIALFACKKETTNTTTVHHAVNYDSVINIAGNSTTAWQYDSTKTYSYICQPEFPDASNPPTETFTVWVRRNGTVSNPAYWILSPTANFYFKGDSIWFGLNAHYYGQQECTIYYKCDANHDSPGYLDVKAQINQ